jgi:hypothetical protein
MSQKTTFFTFTAVKTSNLTYNAVYVAPAAGLLAREETVFFLQNGVGGVIRYKGHMYLTVKVPRASPSNISGRVAEWGRIVIQITARSTLIAPPGVKIVKYKWRR